jgi:2-polyprenyl-6-methoxyphenol hydroxylase-like FAD-dependent oxidoreductase
VNSALEDVCVLERQLDAAADDLAQALPAYEQQRMPDSEALAKLVQVRGVLAVLMIEGPDLLPTSWTVKIPAAATFQRTFLRRNTCYNFNSPISNLVPR